VELKKLKDLIGADLAAFNQLVREKEVPAVVVKEKKKGEGEGEGRGAP